MPVNVKKVKGKYRVMEGSKIAKTDKGGDVDGGGHTSKEKAQAQCNAINASKHDWKPTKRKKK